MTRFVRRVAAFALYNDKKEILLQHRTADAPTWPDYWGLFGGGIEEEETPEEALTRESEEELELGLTNIPLFKRYETVQDDGVHERFVYILPTKWIREELLKQQHEGGDLGFFTYEQTKNMKVTDYNRMILADIAEALDKIVF